VAGGIVVAVWLSAPPRSNHHDAADPGPDIVADMAVDVGPRPRQTEAHRVAPRAP